MRHARAAWRAAELDEIGLHEARHSAISMWIASRLSVKLVSELAGHASVAITLDRYGHLFDNDVTPLRRSLPISTVPIPTHGSAISSPECRSP
jgi:integrase